jgi:hypothetical protein
LSNASAVSTLLIAIPTASCDFLRLSGDITEVDAVIDDKAFNEADLFYVKKLKFTCP